MTGVASTPPSGDANPDNLSRDLTWNEDDLPSASLGMGAPLSCSDCRNVKRRELEI